MTILTGSSGREYKTRTYAEELEVRRLTENVQESAEKTQVAPP